MVEVFEKAAARASRPSTPLHRLVVSGRYAVSDAFMMPNTVRTVTFACIALLSLHAGSVSAANLLDTLRERFMALTGQHSSKESASVECMDGASVGSQAASRVLRDVAYGDDPKQRMDVYLPGTTSGNGPAPVIFMVHGGGWNSGDKQSSNVVDNKVARWVAKGVVFVSVNNRLLPDADPVDQVRDLARALALAQQQAPSWGADPAGFVLMGHSAGGHLVALLTASSVFASEAGVKPILGAVALDSSAMDVAAIMEQKHAKKYDPAFGTAPAFWAAVSPMQQLHAGTKPLLAVCSSQRADSCTQASRYVSRATQLGVRAEVLQQDMSRDEINYQLGVASDYTRSVEGFLSSLSPALAQRLH